MIVDFKFRNWLGLIKLKYNQQNGIFCNCEVTDSQKALDCSHDIHNIQSTLSHVSALYDAIERGHRSLAFQPTLEILHTLPCYWKETDQYSKTVQHNITFQIVCKLPDVYSMHTSNDNTMKVQITLCFNSIVELKLGLVKGQQWAEVKVCLGLVLRQE